VNVAIVPALFSSTSPGSGYPEPVRVRKKLSTVTVDGFTGSVNCTLTEVYGSKPVAPDEGDVTSTVGPTVSGSSPLVNDHV